MERCSYLGCSIWGGDGREGVAVGVICCCCVCVCAVEYVLRVFVTRTTLTHYTDLSACLLHTTGSRQELQ